VGALGAVVVLAACGSSGGSTGGSSSSASLDGTDWVLTAMTPPVAGIADAVVTARFDDGTLSGHSGCNTYRTTYRQDGSDLTIGSDVAGTRMACPPGPTAVEQAYLGHLGDVASFTRSGSTLTLRDSDGTTVLRFRLAPAGEALAGDWSVTSFFTGTALSSPVGADLTATFADGTVGGDGGCNTFHGPAKVGGTTIAIGPLASTMRACEDDAVTTQEQQYLHALELAKRFEVSGTRLTLFRADGGMAVVFERVA